MASFWDNLRTVAAKVIQPGTDTTVIKTYTTTELHIVDEQVRVLRKNGKDIDPESEEGRTLVKRSKTILDRGMKRLEKEVTEMKDLLK